MPQEPKTRGRNNEQSRSRIRSQDGEGNSCTGQASLLPHATNMSIISTNTVTNEHVFLGVEPRGRSQGKVRRFASGWDGGREFFNSFLCQSKG